MAEKRGGVFDNALMLHSEHTRILSDAVKRGDERTADAHWRGIWQGISFATVPILVAAVSGFLFGLSLVR